MKERQDTLMDTDQMNDRDVSDPINILANDNIKE